MRRLTIVLIVVILLNGFVLPAHADLINPDGDDKTADLNAQRERQKKAEGEVDRKIAESQKGKAPKGHRPLTKKEIEELKEARKQRELWAARRCVPNLTRGGMPESRAQEICRAAAGTVEIPRTLLSELGLAPPPPNPELLAQRAVLQLTVPEPTPHVGPPPSINRWKMAVVGYPLWLWSSPNEPVTAQVTEQGITITMTARKTGTDFDLGDGTKLTCTRTKAWTRAVKPNTESPVCGHRYTSPSRKNVPYVVTATDHWEVSWSALGQSGVIYLDPQASIQLPVGELHSVVR
ncbi:hypothetical protein ACQBAU_01165 [Propionibacteriaceae bacterium Y2011]